MPDIRLIRPRAARTWLWPGLLALAAVLVWGVAKFMGDPTAEAGERRIGAAADFGGERAPVLPVQAAPFETLTPLRERDLGRLVDLAGVLESNVVGNTAWIRTSGGNRILLRFEPPPGEGTLRGLAAGSRVDLHGYLQRISRAEFDLWIDSLGVSVPRPRPGRKFGDLPDPEFFTLDSLYIKNFYLSVRPEALAPVRAGA